jgi:hypothetical protein
MHYEKTLVLQIKIVDEFGLDWLTPDKVCVLLKPLLQERLANSGTVSIADLTRPALKNWKECRPPTGGTGAQAPELATLQSLRERIEALEERLTEIGKTADKVAEDAIGELSEKICEQLERIITGGNFLAAWHKLQHTLCCEESA